MKNNIISAIFLCLFIINVKGQINFPSDFKISSNPPGISSVTRENAMIHGLADGSSLISWCDYREGPSHVYMQKCTSEGYLNGKNFKVAGRDLVLPGQNSDFVAIKKSYAYDDYLNSSLIFSGQFSTSESILNETKLISAIQIWSGCIMPPDPDFQGFSTANGYSFLSTYNGIVTIKKFSRTGVLQDSSATGITTAVQAQGVEFVNGNYAVIWFGGHRFFSNDSSSIGLYVNIYSSGDSLLKAGIPLHEIPYGNGYEYYKSLYSYGVIKDPSSPQLNLFWEVHDTLFYANIGDDGQPVGVIQKINCPTYMPNTAMFPFLFPHALAGSVDIFTQRPVSSLLTRVARYTVSADHVLAPTSDTALVLTSAISKGLVQHAPHQYFGAADSANGIWIANFQAGNFHNQSEVSEEFPGSNECHPVIGSYGKNAFLVSWKNEQSCFSRTVGTDGHFMSEQQQRSDFPTPAFFNKDTLLTIWRDPGSDFAAAGFCLENSTGQEIRRDTLRVNGRYASVAASFALNQFSDTSFLFVFRTSDKSYLRIYNAQRAVLREIVLPDSIFSSGDVNIYKEDDTSFYLKGNKLQKYSALLKEIGTAEDGSIFKLLGNDDFYYVSPDYYLSGFGGLEIVSYSAVCHHYNVPGQSSIRIVDYAINPQAFVLAGGYFLAIYPYEGKYLYSLYNVHGKISGPAELFADENYIKDIMVTESGNKVLFTWADNRDGDYDIWGRIYDKTNLIDGINQQKNPITGKNPVLSPNYPNPFNPTTMIEYYLPARMAVNLRIYTVLGQQVEVLCSGEQEQGMHRVAFNAGHLPSGIYIYQLTAGKFCQTKKMLFLK